MSAGGGGRGYWLAITRAGYDAGLVAVAFEGFEAFARHAIPFFL